MPKAKILVPVLYRDTNVRPFFNLDRLRQPKASCNLVRVLTPDGTRPGFETLEKAHKERRTRLNSAARAISAGGDKPFVAAVEQLRERLEDENASSFANPLFARRIRRRFAGAVLDLLARHPHDPAFFVTIMPPAWAVAGDRLPELRPKALLERLRRQLNECGDLAARTGWAIFALHGEWRDHDDVFDPHIHAIVVGEKIEAIGEIGQLPSMAWEEGSSLRGPSVKVQPLRNSARQVSYALQAFWPKRSYVEGRRLPSRGRIGGRRGLQVLLLLNRATFSDVVWLHGVEIRNGRLELRALPGQPRAPGKPGKQGRTPQVSRVSQVSRPRR